MTWCPKLEKPERISTATSNIDPAVYAQQLDSGERWNLEVESANRSLRHRHRMIVFYELHVNSMLSQHAFL